MHFGQQPQDDMAVSRSQPQNISHCITIPPAYAAPHADHTTSHTQHASHLRCLKGQTPDAGPSRPVSFA